MINPFLSEREACDVLQVSRSKLSQLRKAGLPHYRLGRTLRYDEDELRVFLSENRVLTTKEDKSNE